MIQLVARLLFGANTSNILRHCVRARAPFARDRWIRLDWLGGVGTASADDGHFRCFSAEAEQYGEVCAWGRFVPVRWLRNVLIVNRRTVRCRDLAYSGCGIAALCDARLTGTYLGAVSANQRYGSKWPPISKGDG